MRTIQNTLKWSGRLLLAAGVLALAFAPDFGLLAKHPAGLVGLGLLAAGVCLNAHRLARHGG